jgi:hypothetical protein
MSLLFISPMFLTKLEGMSFLAINLFILLLLFWAYFSSGLYFSESIYPILIIMSIVFILYILYGIIRGKKNEVLSFQLLIVIPILYGTSLLFKVESVGETLNKVLLWTFLVGFFYFLQQIGKKENGSRNLRLILNIFNAILLISSFFAISRIIEVPTFILKLNKGDSGLGERLGGFIQYPNVLGALIGSLIMFTLGNVTKEKKNLSILLLPGLFSLLLLTESRGAWVCFIIVWILSFIFVKKENLLSYLSVFVSSIILGLSLYLFIIKDGVILGNIMDFLVLVLITLAMWGMTKISIKLELPSWIKSWHFPVTFILTFSLGALDLSQKGFFYQLLPQSIQHRLIMGTGTLSDRIVYWKDAMAHTNDFIWTGLGGDGWKFLMYRVESAPYLISEIHNSYLNLLIELGIFGFTLIMVVLIWIIYRMIKSKSIHFIPFFFLLLHGVVDFTFSYGLTLMVCLLFIALFFSEEKIAVKKDNGLCSIVTTLLCILFLFSSYISIRFIQAEKFAFEAAGNVNQRESLQEAIRLNPWNSDYRIQDLKVENVSERREKILAQGLRFEPHHGYLLFEYANLLHDKGKTHKAISFYHSAMEYDRYDINKYEKFMEQMYSDAKNAVNKGKSPELYKREANTAYEKALQLEKNENKSIHNQRGFGITKKMEEFHKIISKW